MKVPLPNILNSSSVSAHQRIFRYFYGSRSRDFQHLTFDGPDTLYRRISPLGDPKVSITPVLDQWVGEGKSVHWKELEEIIRELKWYNRCGHALEVSEWMTEKIYMPLTAADVAMRMNLIFKIDGIQAVENYYDGVSEQLKCFKVNTAMLSCYAKNKSVEKAEAIMQKLRVMSICSPLPYNIMMNIHCSLGNGNKLDDLMNEMQGRGIKFDCVTYSTRLKAYAEDSDVEGVDRIVHMVESDPHITMDCGTYSAIAQACLKIGHLDKVLSALKKLEELAVITKTRNTWFDFLLKSYSEIGRKDDVYRIWWVYKRERRKVYNKGYISMLSSLSRLNDVEGMEKIFEEWEASGLSCDFRVLNALVDVYCRNGEVGKAEELIEKGLLKGLRPFSTTWSHIAEGYLHKGEIVKGMEALEKANPGIFAG